MGLSLRGRVGRRPTRQYRLRLRADAGSGFYCKHQVRLLRIYLGATTFLYLYWVVFSAVFPIHRGLKSGNPTGGIVAIALAPPKTLGEPLTRWSLRRLKGYLERRRVVRRIAFETLRAILLEKKITFQRTRNLETQHRRKSRACARLVPCLPG